VRLDIAGEGVFTQVLWRTTHARLLAARGELEEAEREASDAVRLAARTDAPNLHADSLVYLAEILAAANKAVDADHALSEAIRLYTLKGNEVARQRTLAMRSSQPAFAGPSETR
jgi:hypothetical protein